MVPSPSLVVRLQRTRSVRAAACLLGLLGAFLLLGASSLPTPAAALLVAVCGGVPCLALAAIFWRAAWTRVVVDGDAVRVHHHALGRPLAFAVGDVERVVVGSAERPTFGRFAYAEDASVVFLLRHPVAMVTWQRHGLRPRVDRRPHGPAVADHATFALRCPDPEAAGRALSARLPVVRAADR